LQFSRPAPVESEGQLEKDAEHMMIGESDPSVFRVAIEMSLVPIVLADPNQHDYPIIFANAAFCEMTGYDASEIVGRNCRFLQGPDTDKEAVARIRAAVAARWNVSEELVNYRKDGSAFWNALFVNPVSNRGGRLVYLFGTQLDITRRRSLESVLQTSYELLSCIESNVAGALTLSQNELQRERLLRASQAIHEIALRHLPLFGKNLFRN
jgi:PAS domain S-box-containing protein